MPIDRVRVSEQSTKLVEFDVVNELNEAVLPSDLTAATLTLYDIDTFDDSVSPKAGILHSRDAQNVLNQNDVEIDTGGHVTWSMQSEDNAIVTARRQVERHRAVFHFTWDGGAFHFEIEIEVVNLRSV